MKRMLKTAVLAVTLSWVGSASALTIGGTDVGGVDSLLGQTSDLSALGTCATGNGNGNGNSETAELCWINNVLSGSTTYGTKVDPQSYTFVDGDSTKIGFELSSPTEYFFIKNAQWYGLFENTSSFDWAVIDTAAINGGFNLPGGGGDTGYTISHIAPIGGTVTVPEPGTMALLGLGLAGLGFRRRLMKS